MSQSKLKDLNDYAGDFSSALYGLTDNFSQSARRIGKSESYLYKCAEPESETELKAYELPYHEKFPALVQFLFDKYRKINSKFFALNGRQDDELAEIIRLLGEAINLAKDGDKVESCLLHPYYELEQRKQDVTQIAERIINKIGGRIDN